MAGRELAFIAQKLLSWGPTYEITSGGRLMAVVKKKLFTFITCRFTVDVPGPDDLLASGSFLEYEYEFTRPGVAGFPSGARDGAPSRSVGFVRWRPNGPKPVTRTRLAFRNFATFESRRFSTVFESLRPAERTCKPETTSLADAPGRTPPSTGAP